jgi:hypothetical protein
VDDATEDVTASDRADGGSADRVGNWLGELQATMWSRLVVVTEVLVEDRLEMSSGDDEEMVEALFPYGPYPALRDRVRPGDLTGMRMVSTPIEANTASELAVNLVSRSRMRNRNR